MGGNMKLVLILPVLIYLAGCTFAFFSDESAEPAAQPGSSDDAADLDEEALTELGLDEVAVRPDAATLAGAATPPEPIVLSERSLEAVTPVSVTAIFPGVSGTELPPIISSTPLPPNATVSRSGVAGEINFGGGGSGAGGINVGGGGSGAGGFNAGGAGSGAGGFNVPSVGCCPSIPQLNLPTPGTLIPSVTLPSSATPPSSTFPSSGSAGGAGAAGAGIGAGAAGAGS